MPNAEAYIPLSYHLSRDLWPVDFLPVGHSFVATGGSVEGNGGIFNGSVVAGNSAGGVTVNVIVGPSKKQPTTLSVLDDLTLQPTSNLFVPIIGNTAGSGFGQIDVTGTANLNEGTLTIGRPKTFVPAIGSAFPVLTASGSLSGTFGTVNGTSINSSEHFQVGYDEHDVTITVVSGP